MPHTKWSRSIIIALGGAALVTLVLIAFIWPSLTSSVRNVPLAVVGTSQQVKTLTTTLDDKLEGGFVITKVDTRADAVKAIKDRDELGAIILESKPEVLTASAAGTAVSQLLTSLGAQLQVQANQAAQAAVAQAVAAGHAPVGTAAPVITVKVTDVVPLASSDSRGVGLTAAAFPLALGGMLGWFGVLQGNVLVNMGAVSLAMAATAAFIVGANALIGTAGIPLGSVITMLIGNPLSSAAAPVAFMPQPWGSVGQFFVPGSSATLLRDLSYFPAANPTMGWLVLAGWTALGLIGMVAGHFRNQEVVRIPALEEDVPQAPTSVSARGLTPESGRAGRTTRRVGVTNLSVR